MTGAPFQRYPTCFHNQPVIQMLIKPDTSKPGFQFDKTVADRVRANRCTICGAPIFETDFADELSKKEYSISGMCQRCQNKAFRSDENDDT